MGNFSGGGGSGLTLDGVKEDIALSDLSDVAATSGTGTTVPLTTITSVGTNDYLSWNGTNWVNTFAGLPVSNHATGYAMVTADSTKLSTANSGSAVAWTIPDAGGVGFADGSRFAVCNRGAGILTVTRTTASTINGATSATLAQYDCGVFTSDGTNWILSRSSNIPTKTTGTTQFLREDYTLATPSAASFDPNDTATVWMREEFLSGNTTSGSIGSLGWVSNTIGSAPSVLQQAGVYPNVGILRFSTNASPTAGQGGSFFTSSTQAPTGNLAANTNWQIDSIFKLTSITEMRFRVGTSSSTGSIIPTSGLYLRFDVTAGIVDTTFWLCAANTGTETCVNTTVTADTNWHKVRIWSAVVGTVRAQVYDSAGAAQGSEVCLNSGGTGGCTASTIPTGGQFLGVIVGADATTQKGVDLDLFAAKWTSVSR